MLDTNLPPKATAKQVRATIRSLEASIAYWKARDMVNPAGAAKRLLAQAELRLEALTKKAAA